MFARDAQVKVFFLCITLFIQNTYAIPTNYSSFKREQSISYQPDHNKLIRIWMFYVGQGDAILIQIP